MNINLILSSSKIVIGIIVLQVFFSLQGCATTAETADESEIVNSNKSKPEEISSLSPAIDIDRSYWQGEGANINIVEYLDFECPFCRKNFPDIKSLVNTHGDQFNLILKHLPLNRNHKNAYKIAAYFESIRLQDQYIANKFHDIVLLHLKNDSGISWLLSTNDEIKTQNRQFQEKLDSAVVLSGANLKKVKLEWTSEEIQKIIKSDVEEAIELGAQETPFFWINGKIYRGYQSHKDLIQIIENLR